MTKQRIGVLVVCLLVVAAGVAQTPPAKQMAVEEKERGRDAQPAGDAGLGAMDGHSRGSAGRDAVGRDGRNGKDCGPTGRPDDRLGVRTRFGFPARTGQRSRRTGIRRRKM